MAVGAVSTSGSLIVYAAAPALAIAFWRNAFAAGVLVPVAAARRRGELADLVGPSRRQGRYAALAGVALAVHFATWVPSTKMTSIAAAAAMASTQPLWQAVIARAQHRRLPGLAWVGIGVAVAGALAATGADFGAGPAAVLGDLLGLVAGVAAAVYAALGERVRETVSTTTYTTVCYGVCSLLLLVICLIGKVPLGGYPASAWLALAGLTAGPQLLGHSLFSYSMRRVSATTVALLILLEVPGSALIAWAWLGQVPRPTTWPGLALIVVGVAVAILAARNGTGRQPQTPATAESSAAQANCGWTFSRPGQLRLNSRPRPER